MVPGARAGSTAKRIATQVACGFTTRGTRVASAGPVFFARDL